MKLNQRTLTTLQLVILFSTSFAQSPIHYWPLNEATGTVASDAAGQLDGTLMNGPLWQPLGGRHGGALDLDGVDDRIGLGPLDILTGSGITLAAWIKTDNAPPHEQFILAKTSAVAPSDHSWSLSIVNSTALRFRLKTAGVITTLTTPGSVLFPGAWNHVAATYEGTQMKIYLNGSLIAFIGASGSLGYEPNSFASIGDLSSGAQLSLAGLVDEVRIYDQGLSAQAIQTLVVGNVATHVDDLCSNCGKEDAGPWLVLDAMGRGLMQHSNLKEIHRAMNSFPAGHYYVRSTSSGTTSKALVLAEGLSRMVH